MILLKNKIIFIEKQFIIQTEQETFREIEK